MIPEKTNTIITILINLFDVCVILRYFGRLLEPVKKNSLLVKVVGMLFVILLSILLIPELQYCSLVSLAAWSCVFLPAYKGERKNKIVYVILLFAFAGFCQMLMYLLNYCTTIFLYSFFIPHLSFYIIMELTVRCQTIKGKRLNIRILILLISVPIISFVSMPCLVLLSEHMDDVSGQQALRLLLPIAILILYMNIIIFYLYDLISSSYETIKQKDEFEHLVEWQRQYYETLSDNQTVIRKIKHDLQNNLQVILRLIEEKEYDDVEKYLGEMIDEQSKYDRLVSTGNDAIDTVLNIKFSLAEQLGIEVKKDINIPAMLPISYQDSIKIFGNLLDNAINALRNEKVTDRRIKWFMFYNANALMIQCINPYVGKPVKYNKDSFWHGLGLEIVKSTVEEYDGTFDISDDGQIFTVNILLYIDNYIESNKLLQE